MAVTGIAQFITAPIAARLSTRVDLRLLLAIGFALFALGLWLNSFLTSESGFADLALPQLCRGVALLFCFIPINRLSLATLPPHELKNASGVFNLTRNLGGAVGLALLNTLIARREQLHWNRLAAWIDLTRPEVQATLDTLAGRFSSLLPGDADLAALRQLARLVEREAQVLTFNDAFLGLAVLYVAVLLLWPLLQKPRPAVATMPPKG